jgi:CubicO group peptidase (beta-lactamase class C family)
VAVTTVTTATTATTATTDTTGTTSIEGRLAPIVTGAMERFSVPGVTVGLIHQGQEHRLAEGVTATEFPLHVDPQTLFQIGSTTKTYTATVLMMLVEEGKVDLEAPVLDYLPSFRLPDEDAARKVTIRHLVTHTGGFLGDYFDDLGRGADALRRIVRRMAKRTPQVTPVGGTWFYNNAGFYVLGRLLEVVTGTAYEDLVQQRLLDPLGMTMTFFFAEDVITHKTAIGHDVHPDGTIAIARPWGLMRSANPAGGLVSNIDDQLRYAHFHLGDRVAEDGAAAPDKPLLGAATLERMQAPLAPAGSIADAVGVSWLLDEVEGTQLVKHGGSINGHMSEFLLVPEHGFAITVLTNGSRGHELGEVVVDWALAELLGLRRPKPRLQPLEPAAATAYTGRYRAEYGHNLVTSQDDGLLLTLVASPEALEAEPELAALLPPPLPLAFVGDDRAVVQGDHKEGMQVEFLRDDDGAVTWMRFGGRLHRREEG